MPLACACWLLTYHGIAVLQPAGEGKYSWADGSVYTGGWKDGAKHGVGTYTWPSGATYHGEQLHATSRHG